MILLKLTDIEKSFSDKVLFSFPELVVYEYDRIGLVGLNGSGKTSLLEIISGRLLPEKGKVQSWGEITYFRQFADASNMAEPQMLKELGVTDKTDQGKTSGGEKTRLRLAETFSNEKHILLLDEPTSNLDLAGVELLKKNLQRYSTFILVSHDIALLDEFCDRIIEIRDNTLFFYQGNYLAYKEQLEHSRAAQQKEYEAYQKEQKRLQEVYLQKKEKAANMNKSLKKKRSQEKEKDFIGLTGKSHEGQQKSMAKAAKAILSRVEHLDEKEPPKEEVRIRLNFSLTAPPENKIVIRAENLNFAYGEHQIFRDTSFMIYNHQKVGILGPNGCGKTTLLRCIEQQQSSIKIVPRARIGFSYQEFENLSPNMTVLQAALQDSIQNENTVRQVLAGLLFSKQDLRKTVSVLSGGEKMKLSFAKLIVSDANILALDEPTNYLDAPSVEALISILKSYEGTILFVSHDRYFVDQVATDLMIIKDKQVNKFNRGQ